ncbi:lipase family alpha/beta hydrolase [Providencia rettgeri]|uniref:lipase family alpha/beta hydrolase n=1 Tax=Providencia rettgeri TaxID=587 RepID=UPI0034E0D762
MGSNLKHKDTGDSVWRIRSNQALTAWDALGWVFTSGKRRRELLDPNAVETDFGQKVGNDDNESTYFANSRQKRGWGSALGFSYFDSLEKLQKELLIWEDYYNQARKDGIGSAAAATEYFEGKGKDSKSIFQHILDKKLSDDDENPLSLSEATHYRSLLLPLHVFGYNWLQDNAQSAQDLAKYIDEVLRMYNTNENGGIGHGLAFEKGHEKVILVTHSMGGLVSRYASELLDAAYKDKILGIVHGVMPDLGSPTAYKMMKIGEHSMPMGLVLGMSATRLMSVLAQSPAPMQLLPSPKYNHGKPWLRIEKGNQDGVTDFLLPQNGDPFEEIYLQDDVWWRMYESDILDKNDATSKKNFINYKNIIERKVAPFIQKMDNKYHVNTYQFYGAYFDENEPKDSRRSDETVTWKLRDKTSWLWVSDDSRSTDIYGDKREYTLLKSSDKWKSTPSMDYEGGTR